MQSGGVVPAQQPYNHFSKYMGSKNYVFREGVPYPQGWAYKGPCRCVKEDWPKVYKKWQAAVSLARKRRQAHTSWQQLVRSPTYSLDKQLSFTDKVEQAWDFAASQTALDKSKMYAQLNQLTAADFDRWYETTLYGYFHYHLQYTSTGLRPNLKAMRPYYHGTEKIKYHYKYGSVCWTSLNVVAEEAEAEVLQLDTQSDMRTAEQGENVDNQTGTVLEDVQQQMLPVEENISASYDCHTSALKVCKLENYEGGNTCSQEAGEDCHVASIHEEDVQTITSTDVVASPTEQLSPASSCCGSPSQADSPDSSSQSTPHRHSFYQTWYSDDAEQFSATDHQLDAGDRETSRSTAEIRIVDVLAAAAASLARAQDIAAQYALPEEPDLHDGPQSPAGSASLLLSSSVAESQILDAQGVSIPANDKEHHELALAGRHTPKPTLDQTDMLESNLPAGFAPCAAQDDVASEQTPSDSTSVQWPDVQWTYQQALEGTETSWHSQQADDSTRHTYPAVPLVCPAGWPAAQGTGQPDDCVCIMIFDAVPDNSAANLAVSGAAGPAGWQQTSQTYNKVSGAADAHSTSRMQCQTEVSGCQSTAMKYPHKPPVIHLAAVSLGLVAGPVGRIMEAANACPSITQRLQSAFSSVKDIASRRHATIFCRVRLLCHAAAQRVMAAKGPLLPY